MLFVWVRQAMGLRELVEGVEVVLKGDAPNCDGKLDVQGESHSIRVYTNAEIESCLRVVLR